MKSICLVFINLTNLNLYILQGSGLLDSLGLNTPQNRIKNAL